MNNTIIDGYLKYINEKKLYMQKKIVIKSKGNGVIFFGYPESGPDCSFVVIHSRTICILIKNFRNFPDA